jgi:adenylate cyclase
LGAVKERRPIAGVLLVSLGAALLATVFAGAGLLDRFETPTIDLRFRLQRHGTIDPRILMVDVDQHTLDTLGWPVPRENYALLLSAAAHAKATGAMFDMEFVDPAPDPLSDQAFAATLPSLPVVLGEELAIPTDRAPGWPRATSAHQPLAAFAKLSTQAHVQADNMPDGVFRRVPLMVWNGEVATEALGVAGARLLDPGLGAPKMVGTTLELGGRTLPLDRQGLLAIDFRPIPQEQRVSLVDLIGDLQNQPEALDRRLAGKLLLIGYEARSVGDHGAVPLKHDVPLMNVHAAVIDTLLHHASLRIAPVPVTFLLALLVAFSITFAATRLSAVGGALSSLGILFAHALGVAVAFWSGRVELTFTAPLLAGVGAYATTMLSVRREHEAQVKQIRAAFEKYVAPSVLGRILEDPSALNVAGKQAELAILFSDVQGYTSMSNRLPPEQVLNLLREYLDVMSKIILEHEGTIDKIMGDGILAFFGDPIPSANPSVLAVRCGLAMQTAMRALAAKWAAQGYGELKIRVGIATGSVYVGNIGSSDHLEYTVIGPTVNLAARLESNAPAGGVLVADATRAQCGDTYAFEHVTGLKLKGFGADCEAYLCLGLAGMVHAQRSAAS